MSKLRVKKGSNCVLNILEGQQGEPCKLTIKNGCKLGDVIYKLPHGIIQKNQTGIGATTLELKSKRNSIIVEPLKVTASTKAFGSKALYIGSPTQLHSQNVTDEKIKSYLNDTRIKYKKIVVVVDSLKKLLKHIPNTNYKNYFLMIDESDTIQLDSNFRNEAMQNCMYYYKKFPVENRCLVSATPVKTHDPDLVDEDVTEFNYEVEPKRRINLIYTNEVFVTLKNRILSHYREPETADKKIVVAFNNVSGLKSLADDIVKAGVLAKDIKILCGVSSKEKAGDYFAELDSDIFPSKIILKTSAYYSGFDIGERYHVIIVLDSASNLNCLSLKRIKQIVGRCRDSNGLLSESIVYRYININQDDNVKFEELIQWSQEGMDAFNCIDTVFGKSSHWSKQSKDIYSSLTDKLTYEKYYLLAKAPDTEKMVISYLSIDAIIEWQNTRKEFYSSKKALEQGLKSEGHNVLVDKEEHELAETSNEQEDKSKISERVEQNLKMMSNNEIGEFPLSSNKLENLAYEIFKEFRIYTDHGDLIHRLVAGVKKTNSKALQTLQKHLKNSIRDDSSTLKTALQSQFKLGTKVSDSELLSKVKNVLTRLGGATALSNLDITKARKCLRECMEFSTKHENDEAVYFIKSYNPSKVKIVSYRMDEKLSGIGNG